MLNADRTGVRLGDPQGLPLGQSLFLSVYTIQLVVLIEGANYSIVPVVPDMETAMSSGPVRFMLSHAVRSVNNWQANKCQSYSLTYGAQCIYNHIGI